MSTMHDLFHQGWLNRNSDFHVDTFQFQPHSWCHPQLPQWEWRLRPPYWSRCQTWELPREHLCQVSKGKDCFLLPSVHSLLPMLHPGLFLHVNQLNINAITSLAGYPIQILHWYHSVVWLFLHAVRLQERVFLIYHVCRCTVYMKNQPLPASPTRELFTNISRSKLSVDRIFWP